MKGSILLVDDNPDFLDSTQDVLEEEGYLVKTAVNGEDALNKAIKDPFDIILMDIKMPGLNGVESFIKMKESKPDVKVILITAYSLEDLIQKARDEGVCEILNKPLDMNKLIDAIEAVKMQRDGGCILVADDDGKLCDSLFDVLTHNGYQVAVACDGHEAVDRAKNRQFDLLLLDMKLPHLNGLEVYRRIKAQQPNLVTIIMTGYAEEMHELIEQTLEENAYTCLTKPLKMDTLVKLLDELFMAKRNGYYAKKDSEDYD